jgi:hypothetical protein
MITSLKPTKLTGLAVASTIMLFITTNTEAAFHRHYSFLPATSLQGPSFAITATERIANTRSATGNLVKLTGPARAGEAPRRLLMAEQGLRNFPQGRAIGCSPSAGASLLQRQLSLPRATSDAQPFESGT